MLLLLSFQRIWEKHRLLDNAINKIIQYKKASKNLEARVCANLKLNKYYKSDVKFVSHKMWIDITMHSAYILWSIHALEDLWFNCSDYPDVTREKFLEIYNKEIWKQ